MSSKVCMILVWFFVICLLVVGLVMVSSTAAWAEETKHPYEPLFKQTAFACAGLVGALVLSRIDYRIWRKYISVSYTHLAALISATPRKCAATCSSRNGKNSPRHNTLFHLSFMISRCV